MLLSATVLITTASAPQLERITFIDYYRPVHAGGDSSGDGEPCSVTGDKYRKISGGLKWKEFPVTYYIDPTGSGDVEGDGDIDGDDVSAAITAVKSAFSTWDAEEHPAGDFFTQATSKADARIVVSWEPMDGPGGALASASLTYTVPSKEIVYVEIRFDSDDSWRVFQALICGEQTGGFDIEDVAAHEIGHAVGLDHVNQDAYLTMHTYVLWEGETHKRTLGLGDKLGLEALYGDGENGGGTCPPRNPKC